MFLQNLWYSYETESAHVYDFTKWIVGSRFQRDKQLFLGFFCKISWICNNIVFLQNVIWRNFHDFLTFLLTNDKLLHPKIIRQTKQPNFCKQMSEFLFCKFNSDSKSDYANLDENFVVSSETTQLNFYRLLHFNVQIHFKRIKAFYIFNMTFFLYFHSKHKISNFVKWTFKFCKQFRQNNWFHEKKWTKIFPIYLVLRCNNHPFPLSAFFGLSHHRHYMHYGLGVLATRK